MQEKQLKPFLKWAGGKTQLLADIAKQFPYHKNDKFTYIEPFVGSGAVLFWVLNHFPNIEQAVINDVNKDLINTYKMIKKDVYALIAILKKFEDEYYLFTEISAEKKEYYYAKRTLFNTRSVDNVTQAALFIFLNRTCFNGLYRVNRKNLFNVPIGSYKKPLICNKDNLLLLHKSLQKVTILSGDFTKTINYITTNTIFYFDPPYKPLSETSSFNAYAKAEFNDSEQKRLKVFCDDLTSFDCYWILSNSDVKGHNPDNDFFDDLFKKYQINRVVAKRMINSNPKKRGQLTELLITNQVILNKI